MAKDADGLHIQTEEELALQIEHYDSEGDKMGDPTAPDEETE